MSDIFKKIRSIEVEDDAVTDALGLSRHDNSAQSLDDREAATSEPLAPAKPLNLSIPEDDDILDLDDLSLEVSEELPPFDLPDLDIEADMSPKARPISRLGLSPIMPLAVKQVLDTNQSQPARLQPIGQANAPQQQKAQSEVKPLPDFLESRRDVEPTSDKLTRSSNRAADNAPVAADHSEDVDPYDQTPLADGPAPIARFITIMGVLAAVIWAICVGLLLTDMLGHTGAWGSMSALQKLGFTMMALFPLVLIGLATYAFRHINSLSRASSQLKVTAEALMTPDETVITRSTIMAKSIQAQIDEVNLKVSSALTRMELLDDMVKSQGSSLAKSTLAIDTTASDVEHRISTQRKGLENIANLFEGRMTTLSTMLDGHTVQLASSGQMAEQRVQEARMSVEGAAEKLASASETVRQNAVVAAQTLSGSHVEITKLGDDVQAQSTRLDAVYRQHLNDLKVMLSALREQQDELGVTMEERLSKMRDMSLSAKVGAESLTEASIKGRETVEALNEAASLTDTAVRARFSEMEEMVKYSTVRAESISETATRQVQNSLSMTRKEIARIEADMMDLMDKLSHAEASKAALPPQAAAPASLKTTTPESAVPSLRRERFTNSEALPTPTADKNDFRSMEYRDITNEAQPIEPALFSLRRPIEDTPPPPPNGASSELEIYQPTHDDLPAVLRRPSGEDGTKDRGKWSLRGLFGGYDGDSPPPSARTVTDEDIISRLTTLGLTPAAIVDDGCIIEASNLRKVKGAAAMSQAVAKRLSEPVRHLFMATETDADFKLDIRTFTQQFDERLGPIESDREGIRTRLESDAGRAYLLCDAALNG